MFLVLVISYATFIQPNLPKQFKQEPASAKELLNGIMSEIGTGQKYRIGDGMVDVYRSVNGFDFDIPSENADTYSANLNIPDAQYISTKQSIDDYFESFGYKKADKGMSGAGRIINYDGQKYSCRFDEWGLSNVANVGSMRTILLSCASFENVVVKAKKMEIFHRLLEAEPNLQKGSIKMMQRDEEASKTAGYTFIKRAATVTTNEGRMQYAAFYKNPSGVWGVAFHGVGDFKCSDVIAEDARKAFAGQKCFEADGRTVITIE